MNRTGAPSAFGVHVPWFERFLVKVMRAYRDEIDDEGLRADVQAIIGQEAHHAFNFRRWTQRMNAAYPALAGVDDAARRSFETAFDRGSRRYRIGLTAGYETFTFLAGAIILDRYSELMERADPTLRALWVWHQVEEVEHGAVAFDFYRYFYPDDEWYRRAMILRAFGHMALETFHALRAIQRAEGRTLRDRARTWRYFLRFSADLFVAALPVFARDYHPRRHPICTDRQNPVAVGWRRWVGAGADARHLDADAVDAFLAQADTAGSSS